MAKQSNKRLHIRTKRLAQLDDTKLAVAFWLLAKDTRPAEPSPDTAPVTLPQLPTNEDDAEAA
ncbi:MAG TPA: hypothetical protein VMB05_18165 [Solirubrobacteraceae bacterium]|nr:hypothetical protein [Solirubrobacteraceae bacterium]